MELRELNGQEIKERVFGLLKHIDKICTDNDLPYSLCYGTLLGAKRHKGFIPWDDDVDICLLREDYEKLINVLKEEKGIYRLADFSVNSDYYYNFAKIVDTSTFLVEHGNLPINNYGIYVDIFPLDNSPVNEKDFARLTKKIRKYSILKTVSITRMTQMSGDWKRKIVTLALAPIAKLFGYKFWLLRIDALLKSWEDGECVCCFTENPKYKEILRRSDIFPLDKIEFNGAMFSCFKESESYLVNRYGDYMQLPPVEKRISHHNYTAYEKAKAAE